MRSRSTSLASPSTICGRGEISVCCDILVRALMLLNEVLKLDLDRLAADLSAEYKAAFGDDLVEPETQST